MKTGLNRTLRTLTLECWVRRWKADTWAGLLAQYNFSKSCGFGLFVNEKGGLSFCLSDGKTFLKDGMHSGGEGRLKDGKWHHVVATWDGKEKTLWLDAKKLANLPFSGVATGGKAPLRLAAAGKDGMADYFLDADLAMPIIYNHALNAGQIDDNGPVRLPPCQPTGRHRDSS